MIKHITLKEIESNLDYLRKMYDAVRLVNPVEKCVLEYKECSVSKMDTACYGYWKNGKVCENCISVRAYKNNKSFMKLEYKPEVIMMVTAIPLEKTESPVVLELLKDVTESMIFCSSDYSSEHLLYDMVLNFNNMIIRDELTQLFNRRFINEHLPTDMNNASMSDTPLSVIFLDVDDLKSINDKYGHSVGDLAIIEVGNAIKNCIRANDWVARYGGDEFLICLNNANYDEACNISKGICNSIEEIHIPINNKNISITVSMGIFTMHDSDLNVEDIINLADKKMYENKRNSKNCKVRK